MLRFVLDTDSGLHAIQRLNWGAVFTLTTVYLPLQPGLWYTVTLDSVNTYSHQISVNGVPLVSTVDYSWSQGGPVFTRKAPPPLTTQSSLWTAPGAASARGCRARSAALCVPRA